MEKLTIVIEKGKSGAWFASSPDYKGMIAVSPTFEGIFVDIPIVLAALEEARAALAKEQT